MTGIPSRGKLYKSLHATETRWSPQHNGPLRVIYRPNLATLSYTVFSILLIFQYYVKNRWGGWTFHGTQLKRLNMQQASKHDPISVYSILFYNVSKIIYTCSLQLCFISIRKTTMSVVKSLLIVSKCYEIVQLNSVRTLPDLISLISFIVLPFAQLWASSNIILSSILLASSTSIPEKTKKQNFYLSGIFI